MRSTFFADLPPGSHSSEDPLPIRRVPFPDTTSTILRYYLDLIATPMPCYPVSTLSMRDLEDLYSLAIYLDCERVTAYVRPGLLNECEALHLLTIAAKYDDDKEMIRCALRKIAQHGVRGTDEHAERYLEQLPHRYLVQLVSRSLLGEGDKRSKRTAREWCGEKDEVKSFVKAVRGSSDKFARGKLELLCVLYVRWRVSRVKQRYQSSTNVLGGYGRARTGGLCVSGCAWSGGLIDGGSRSVGTATPRAKRIEGPTAPRIPDWSPTSVLVWRYCP